MRSVTALITALLVVGGSAVTTSSPANAAPAPEAAVLDVTSVTAGTSHACARRSNGTVVCWGENTNGQLGDDSNLPRTRAFVVRSVAGTGPLTGVLSVTAGGAHTCAILTSH